jgi:hypothetical protein
MLSPAQAREKIKDSLIEHIDKEIVAQLQASFDPPATIKISIQTDMFNSQEMRSTIEALYGEAWEVSFESSVLSGHQNADFGFLVLYERQ